MSVLDDVGLRFFVDGQAPPGWGRVGAVAETTDGYGWASRQVADVIRWSNPLDTTGMDEVDWDGLVEYLRTREWPSPEDQAAALRHIVASEAFIAAAPKRWPPTTP